MKLKGKYALVTGGSRGIGKGIALALAREGVHVAINYHSNHKQAEKTLTVLKEANINAVKLQADITEIKEVKQMRAELINNFGKLDILINNAGITGPNSSLKSITHEEWQQVIAVNLTGAFNCCKEFVSDLEKAGGKIVNISSISGKMGGVVGCHYAASKAGLHGLTFALASELAPAITVNAVAPGPVDTEIITEEEKKMLAGKTPFNRVAAVEEVAHSVIFLLENDYVSGEIVDVNAARYMD